jgi:hypothetical protein
MIKMFNFLLIIILATSLGCASKDVKLQDKRMDELAFVDSSNGLPLSGQWRHGIAFYDINEDGHIDILAPSPRQASKGYVGRNGENPGLISLLRLNTTMVV